MLNADQFIHSGGKYYEKRFPEILAFIISAYRQMSADKEPLENHEVSITEILVESYLNKKEKRDALGIDDVVFNREPAENSGFVDIKVQTLYSLRNPEAYYIFECKRLDGKAKLNRKYIREGIMRFTAGKYSSYFGVNGLIAYEVNKLDTSVNVQKINSMLLLDYPNVSLAGGMQPVEPVADFKFCYRSLHHLDSSTRLRLFHLMLDVSSLIDTNH
ncbi:MAG: hypothetical protein GY765_40380 [bacterium]|nr:hypothetical protein [bacterium]